MGMDWLKNLVGATDQMITPGTPMQGGPPGWTPPYASPPQTYGAQAPYGTPSPYGAPPPYGASSTNPSAAPAPAWGPPGGAYVPSPSGPLANPPGWTPPDTTPTAAPAPHPHIAAAPSPDARVLALEARCNELQRDVEAIALFAQTLLTLLEEKKIITQEQFQETRRKLDLLDGKLDDRIG